MQESGESSERGLRVWDKGAGTAQSCRAEKGRGSGFAGRGKDAKERRPPAGHSCPDDLKHSWTLDLEP